jgi:3-hydroxyisobutyrate dehydrogenase
LRVGEEFGLDPAVMIDVINASTGRSFSSENLIKQEVLSKRFGSGFAVGLLAKDVKIAADLAEQIGIEAPVGRLARDLWREASETLGADQDHSRAPLAWAERRKRR